MAPVASPPVADPPTSLPATLSPTDSPSFVPKPHPQGIAWGRYNFSETIAENDSGFSLDVKVMYTSTDPVEAAYIYNETSKNAPNGISGLSGIRRITNLMEFSTQASKIMSQDPLNSFIESLCMTTCHLMTS